MLTQNCHKELLHLLLRSSHFPRRWRILMQVHVFLDSRTLVAGALNLASNGGKRMCNSKKLQTDFSPYI